MQFYFLLRNNNRLPCNKSQLLHPTVCSVRLNDFKMPNDYMKELEMKYEMNIETVYLK